LSPEKWPKKLCPLDAVAIGRASLASIPSLIADIDIFTNTLSTTQAQPKKTPLKGEDLLGLTSATPLG